jgi:ERCC4-type nuclease
MAEIKIIIDDRERQTSAKIEDIIYGGGDILSSSTTNGISITSKIKRLTIADYILLLKPKDSDEKKILALIERKTWSDFSSSIKDGRHYNKDKMLEMQKEDHQGGGCSKVIYVVEGPRPAIHQKVDGIPYTTLESAIFHLIWRDNIQVLFSNSAEETADLLIRLCLSLGRLYKKKELIFKNTDSGGTFAASLKDINEIKSEINNISSSQGDETASEKQQKIDNNINNINNIHWSCIDGISPEVSKIISSSSIKVADIVAVHEVDYDTSAEFDSSFAKLKKQIEDIKLPSMRRQKLTKPQVEAILFSPIKDDFLQKVLSLIEGISKKTAENIAAEVNKMRENAALNENEWWKKKKNITFLLSLSAAEIENIVINNRRLGPSKAKKILETLGKIEWE